MTVLATFFPAINVSRGFIDMTMMNTSNALKNVSRQKGRKRNE
jgi:hypothetical protein